MSFRLSFLFIASPIWKYQVKDPDPPKNGTETQACNHVIIRYFIIFIFQTQIRYFLGDFAGLNIFYKNFRGKYSLQQLKMILIARMTKMMIEMIMIEMMMIEMIMIEMMMIEITIIEIIFKMMMIEMMIDLMMEILLHFYIIFSSFFVCIILTYMLSDDLRSCERCSFLFCLSLIWLWRVESNVKCLGWPEAGAAGEPKSSLVLQPLETCSIEVRCFLQTISLSWRPGSFKK